MRHGLSDHIASPTDERIRCEARNRENEEHEGKEVDPVLCPLLIFNSKHIDETREQNGLRGIVPSGDQACDDRYDVAPGE